MVDLVPQASVNIDIIMDFFQKLVLATFIGILIGIEREHRRSEGPDRSRRPDGIDREAAPSCPDRVARSGRL